MRVALYSLENFWLFWVSQATPHSDLIIPRNWQKWFYIWNRYPSGREVYLHTLQSQFRQVQASRKDTWFQCLEVPGTQTQNLFLLVTESSSSPPSDDFKNLLKCLLRKNPDERSGHANQILLFLLSLYSQGRNLLAAHRLIWLWIILQYLVLCSSEWNGQSCWPTLSGHK